MTAIRIAQNCAFVTIKKTLTIGMRFLTSKPIHIYIILLRYCFCWGVLLCKAACDLIGEHMKEKSLVLIEFTGRELDSGRVIDTTSEQAAKDAGLYKENTVFKPLPIIVGNGDVIKGIDEALGKMNEGEQKKIRLGPEKAFGERRKDLIVLVPLAEFTKRKIQPAPGLIVDLNGSYGRVQTVSGGRVRIDLNNDLAGKDVEYDIKVVREVKDGKEKIQVLAEKFFPLKEKVLAQIQDGNVLLKMPKEIGKQLAPLVPIFTKTIKEVVPEVKSVEIADLQEIKNDGPEKKGKK